MEPTELAPGGIIGLNTSVEHGIHFLPDGERFVASIGQTMIVASLSDLGCPRFFHGHTQNIACLAVSPSGRLAATGTRTHIGFTTEICVWDVEAGELLHRFELHQVLTRDLAFSASERFLASIGGPDDNRILVWDLDAGAPLAAAAIHLRTMNRVAFLHGDDATIVTAGEERIYVWSLDVAGRTLTAELVNLGQLRRTFLDMHIAEDDESMFLGTRSGDVVLVNLRARVFKGSVPGGRKPLPGPVTALGTNLSGNVVAATNQGNLVLIRRDSLQITQRGAVAGAVTAIAQTPSRPFFLVATREGSLFRVDRRTFDSELVLTAPVAPVAQAFFAPGLSAIFATAGGEGVSIWDRRRLDEVLRVRVPGAECLCGLVSPDGGQVVTGWDDGAIRSFGPQSGRLLFTIRDAHERVTALAMCDDGLFLYSGGSDGRVRQWHVTASHQVLEKEVKQHSAAVTRLVFRADGRELVSSSLDGSCQVWEMPGLRRVHELKDATMFSAIAYNDDETQVVTVGHDHFITWWSVVSGEPIRKIEGSPAKELTALAVSPCGRFLAVGAGDALVRIWEYDSGELAALGRAHSAPVRSLAFAPDGRTLTSAGDDAMLVVWRLDALRGE
eukprot:gnl/Chilomastix_cuspidata/2263.p1 GENE.gnl/Chilomastix_cuspidata/2263~~gnl/Chilomastix_cuspidata/2263.p1  ORF type:complete len:613 (-),score=334.91 gnl/Chilomastix_cuspidata/2263:761-2599(-)